MFKHILLLSMAMAFGCHAQEVQEYHGNPILTGVTVQFADNSVAFSPDAIQAEILSGARDAAAIYIRGRTSTNKPSAADERLALNRAISARNYLVSRGVSPLKISINYASAADFVASNNTREGRLQNQRVEVELIHVVMQAQE